MSANFKPKQTAAGTLGRNLIIVASRGILATVRLSCFLSTMHVDILDSSEVHSG